VLDIIVEGQRFDVGQKDEVVKTENCSTLHYHKYLRFQTGKNSVSAAGQLGFKADAHSLILFPTTIATPGQHPYL